MVMQDLDRGRTNFVRRGCFVGIYLGMAVAGCGPAKPTSQPADPPPTSGPAGVRAQDAALGSEYADVVAWPGRTHVVQPGESLFSLAQLYYGDSNQWRRIWSANKRRVTNPRNIPVGMKLIIP